MKKKRITKLTLLLLALIMLIGSTSVFAGEYCTIIRGTGAASKSFTLKATSKKDYFCIAQAKGTMKHGSGFTNSKAVTYKTSKVNGYYNVRIYDATAKKESVKIFKSGSEKYKLKKNHTYKVTIQPVRLTDLKCRAYYTSKLGGLPQKWTKYSSWTVTIP